MAGKTIKGQPGFVNEGKGVTKSSRAISLRFSKEIEDILFSGKVGKASEYARNAVIKQMKEDGLL